MCELILLTCQKFELISVLVHSILLYSTVFEIHFAFASIGCHKYGVFFGGEGLKLHKSKPIVVELEILDLS